MLGGKSNYFESRLQDPHFTNIKNGTKKIEGRPNRGKFSKMKKGDIVLWKNSKDETKIIKTQITNIHKYDTFKQMLEFEGLKNTLPNVKNMKEGVNVYLKPSGFYDKLVQKDGIIAIEIVVIN